MKVLVWKDHGDIRVYDATCPRSMIDVCNSITEYRMYYNDEDMAVFSLVDEASASGSLENIFVALTALSHHFCEIEAEDFDRLEFVEMNTCKEYK